MTATDETDTPMSTNKPQSHQTEPLTAANLEELQRLYEAAHPDKLELIDRGGALFGWDIGLAAGVRDANFFHREDALLVVETINALPQLLALARAAITMRERLEDQIPIVSYGTQQILLYIRDGNDDDAARAAMEGDEHGE